MMEGEIVDKRIVWIDTLRGIGITLVVQGHYSSNSFATAYIYSFHVPLFFFVSGYLFRNGRYSGYLDILKNKVQTRIVPYVFFFLVSYVLQLLRLSSSAGMNPLSLMAVDDFRPMFFQQMALLLRSNGESLKNINVALWFIPCLLVTELMFYSLHRLTSSDIKKISAVLVLFALGGYAESIYVHQNLPWAIDTALTALVFYGLGYVYRNSQLPRGIADRGNKRMALFLFVISTIVCILFAKLNVRVDMNARYYGNFFYFYLGALSGIFSYLVIVPLIPGQRLLSFLGKNTLTILGTHLDVYPIAITGLNRFVRLFVPENETLVLQYDLYVFIITLLGLALIAPIAYGINRFFPFVVGKKRVVHATTL
jgi:acyltransferase